MDAFLCVINVADDLIDRDIAVGGEVRGIASVVLKDNPYASRYHTFGLLNTLSLRMAAGAADSLGALHNPRTRPLTSADPYQDGRDAPLSRPFRRRA